MGDELTIEELRAEGRKQAAFAAIYRNHGETRPASICDAKVRAIVAEIQMREQDLQIPA